MIVCVALDDNNGMMFNGRRQTKDRVLRECLLKECGSETLWMNAYSGKQFDVPLAENIVIDENFLDKALGDEYCFVEDASLKEHLHKINGIIVFRWNRVYPADKYFDICLTDKTWSKVSVTDFQGYSHNIITKEVWKRYEKENE